MESAEKEKKENRLIVIAGPTAVGKSKTAVELAELLHTEVISADSMQVYRGMDIGTAKITAEEMRGIPHSLISVLDPSEDFDVTKFLSMAEPEVDRIQRMGKIPVVCGGTGFYIDALLYGSSFPEETEDRRVREELHRLAEEKGEEAVWERLREVDPEYAAATPKENLVKCIRGVEFFTLHGKKLSEHNRELAQDRKPRYDSRLFVLTDDREALNERIHRRVDEMMEKGLLEETKALLSSGIGREKTAMQAIGYRQLLAYLDGESDLPEAVANIKTASRRYAKRQVVWFKREKDAVWIDVGKEDPVAAVRKELGI